MRTVRIQNNQIECVCVTVYGTFECFRFYSTLYRHRNRPGSVVNGHINHGRWIARKFYRIRFIQIERIDKKWPFRQ